MTNKQITILKDLITGYYVQAKNAIQAKDKEAFKFIGEIADLILNKYFPTAILKFSNGASKSFKAFDYDGVLKAHYLEYGEKLDTTGLSYIKFLQRGDYEISNVLVLQYNLSHTERHGFEVVFAYEKTSYTIELYDDGTIKDSLEFGEFYEEVELEFYDIAGEIESFLAYETKAKNEELYHKREIETM